MIVILLLFLFGKTSDLLFLTYPIMPRILFLFPSDTWDLSSTIICSPSSAHRHHSQSVRIADAEQLQIFWKLHGARFAAFIADELARIEAKVRDKFPMVKHVDLKLF